MARPRKRARNGGSRDSGFGGFPAYVPVAERRARARAAAKQRPGSAPVIVAGRRKIAETFWGKAWCENLERYSDFSNRLPRGRTYVRSGAVIDLQIEPGEIRALVQGTSLYKVTINIRPIDAPRWQSIVDDCAGSVDSLVDLLQGKLPARVLEVVTRRGAGLFPAPAEIGLKCSCPDWATMCKHVAAVLYGVGVRLDQDPAFLFQLRGVDPSALTARVATASLTDRAKVASERRLERDDLSALFGIEIDGASAPEIDDAPATPEREPMPISPARAVAESAGPSSRAATRPAKATPARKAGVRAPARKKKAAKKRAGARAGSPKSRAAPR